MRFVVVRRRGMLAVVTALALVAATVAGAAADESDETESGFNREVTLRLTLHGPVVPTDAFIFAAHLANPASGSDIDWLVGQPGVVCGPPSATYPDSARIEPCAERTYEATVEVPVEETFDYVILRDENISDGENGSEVVYTTTVPATATFATASRGDRTPLAFTVVYDYSPRSLPDTAVPPPAAGQ
ncbi:MAG TPA: hypothetical protein VHG52_08025 [Thermomicrobiales bacterium]|nr:hypothetical protein [Thermomicrobiales bacterium]